MTGGGGRPRAGRMCLGSAAPRRQGDDREAVSELAAAEKALAADLKVVGDEILLFVLSIAASHA